jgi:carboxypeptidase Taq
VTYFLHVLLRYRIERDLIEGRVEVDQLPELWTESSYDLLGIAPQDHGEGVLQDVHWFVAKFGYFPSYTLGHMMGAQFYKTMRQDLPDFFGMIQRGDFLPITAWLNKYVHSRGRLMNTDELMRDVTGKAPSPDFLISHFKERYLVEEIT